MINEIISKIIWFIPLISATILDIVVFLVFYLWKKRSKNGIIVNPVVEQIIIGIGFGLCTIYATEIGGIDISGAIINARNAAVLSAGLIFGAPAGIIAGIIGGVERWFCVYWGGGAYTRAGCTIACFVAGIVAALFRIFVFHKKTPKAYYGFFIAIIVEVFHVLLVFVTHVEDPRAAFNVVQQVTYPITIATSVTVFVTLLIDNMIGKKYAKNENIDDKSVPSKIADILQKDLLIMIIIVFVLSIFYEIRVLRNSSIVQTEVTINIVVNDAKNMFIEENQTQLGLYKEKKYSLHIGEKGGVFITNKDFNAEPYIDSNGESVINKFVVDKKARIREKKLFYAKLNDVDVCCTYVEMNDSAKKGEGYGRKIVGYLPIKEAFFDSYMAIHLTAFIYIIIFALLFILIYVIINFLVVKNITYLNETMLEISKGNLNRTVEVRTSEEFNSLSNYINNMVSSLKEYIEASKQRIAEELELAKKIQGSSLPSKFPPYPSNETFDIFALMEAAKDVGGDFYDFYFTTEDEFMFLIADVSGKGIPGAMFMMKAKSIIKSYAEAGLSIEEIATNSNNELCANNDAEMFVTSFICIVNLKTGMIKCVNAGHNPPIVLHNNGNAEYIKLKTNFVFAGMNGIKYKSEEFKMEHGDKIFLYTDGVTEAINVNKEQFGEERLLNSIKSHCNDKMNDLCHNVKSDLDIFVDGNEQFDDITMLAFKYN